MGKILKLFTTCILLVLALFLYSSSASAITIRVPKDLPFVQVAINLASAGDIVLVADGAYTENLDFKGKAITVQSENGPGNCIIDCENNGRGFYFHSGEGNDSVLSGFTITNGNMDPSGGGGLITGSSNPTIENCIIQGNSAGMYGGGVFCSASSPVFSNCTISDNNAGLRGGGMFLGGEQGASPSITNCKIIGNSARSSGAGIYSVDSSPEIINSIINNNSVKSGTSPAGCGGGIYFADSGWYCYPVLTNCIIAKNTANNGGAICMLIVHATYLTITNCTISLNEAKTTGGGIFRTFRNNSNTNIINSIVWANTPNEIVGLLDTDVS